MNGTKAWAASVLAAAIAFGTASSRAGDDPNEKQREQDAIREALQRGEVLPLARILALTQQAVPGDVIMVELERSRARLVYELKVLTQTGRVREVRIDARTGNILEIEDD